MDVLEPFYTKILQITPGNHLCIFVCLFCFCVYGFSSFDNSRSSDIRKTASVQFSVGDPLTPGNAATEHAVREEQAHTLPKIPSVAVAWQDAFSLLNITQGHGVEMDNSGSICNLTYFSGPSQAHVQLVNRHAYEIKPVWNVMGKIKGSVEPHRAIIVGAHRDGVSSSAAAILVTFKITHHPLNSWF